MDTRYETARRLIAMTQSLSEMGLNKVAQAQPAQLTAPLSIKFVGSNDKVQQTENDLKVVAPDGPGLGPDDEFLNDLETMTRRECASQNDCIQMVHMFCEAYPAFTLADFVLTDKSGKTMPIPQQGEQLQLDLSQF